MGNVVMLCIHLTFVGQTRNVALEGELKKFEMLESYRGGTGGRSSASQVPFC